MRSDVDGVCAGSSLFDADALCSGEPNVFVSGDRPCEYGDPELAEGRRYGGPAVRMLLMTELTLGHRLSP